MQAQSDYGKRKKELEMEYLSKYCLEILGSRLVEDTDYEETQDGEYHTYKTEDEMFMFVPQLDDPVMSGRTLRGERPTGRYHYSVEVGVYSGGSYWEPPDYDQVEIGRGDGLYQCIRIAAHYLLDQKMDCIGEGQYFEIESQLDKEFPNHFEW